jgi:LuxR family quorum sensing-dependent transcriptional regulator
MYVWGNDRVGSRLLVEQSTLDFVEKLDRVETPQRVGAIFQGFVESLGFVNAACITLPDGQVLNDDCVLMNSRPSGWSHAYLAMQYVASDPMVRELFRSHHPFAWSDVTAARRLEPLEERVMHLARDFGMDSGFVVPIFESSGIAGLVSIAGQRAELPDPIRGALTLASTYVHNTLCTFRRQERNKRIRLTRREAEVLKWIAGGKSDWEIGRILSISAKTVNYHVENVKRKFGVGTRVQAVVAALRQGRLAH